MTTTNEQQAQLSSLTYLLALACGHFALHVFTNGNYGIFRDEFYYLACADHLAWGYVDHPPFSIAVLKLWRMLFGDSVMAIRMLPALFGACLVMLTGMLARELRGGRFAQIMAGLCAFVTPSYLGMTAYFSMNSFDLLFWGGAFYLVLRLLNTKNQQYWIWLGALLGLGLMNKLSVLFFGFGLVLGLLFTPHRKILLEKYPWIGGALALLFFLPNIVWQMTHDWATLEFMRNAKLYKISDLSPLEFFLGQILEINPINVIVWGTGLVVLLFVNRYRPYQLFGWMYLLLFVFFTVQKSKVYYLAPVYPILFAAGAAGIETFFHRRMGWAKTVLVLSLVVGGLFSAPFAIPLLPVETLIWYQNVTGIRPSAGENIRQAVLPQHFADRFGWENMAKTVASAYSKLTPEQQADCVILARNYGEAGAMEYYREAYNLPPVMSAHNNYYLWGYGDISGNVVISIGEPEAAFQGLFEEMRQVAIVESPYAMPYETDLPIYLCVNVTVPLKEIWPKVKSYI